MTKVKKDNCPIEHRMNFLLGHLKANIKMIEEGRYCIDIIRQNQAVISALGKVNELILRHHLDTCVTQVVKGKNKKGKKKIFDEIIDVFNEK